MNGPLFIGIDGGGTNCRTRIRDAAGRLLGEGAGGPANARLDAGLVMGSILTASRAAASAAGLTEDDLRRAHAGFGLAGASLGSAVEKLLAEPNPFGSIMVETDAYIAWLGAYQGRDGAILIMGTGSNGLAVVGGQRFNVAGWGAEVSDEASGMWIGREAIRRALWSYDGRAAATPLSDAVLAHFGRDEEAIIGFATTARPADYARFVPMVLDHAGRGDPLAEAILIQAMEDAVGIISRLLEVGAPSVCLLGGIAEPLSARLPPALRSRIAKPIEDALDGAIRMAQMAQPRLRAATES